MLCLSGPTGAGKSDLAIVLAERFDGEVVNCDSLQFYRGMDIGTAKPTAAERARVPHHLFDTLEPDAVMTAGAYAAEARAVLAAITARGRLPIVCGGAGFYLRALVDGLADAPRRDDGLRARLNAAEDRRPGVLHRYLQRLDRPAAALVHARDRNRLVRAIEVGVQREPWSAIPGKPRMALEGYSVLMLGLHPPREALYSRINHRVDQMFAGGLLEEVNALRGRGYHSGTKALESVGYKQCLAYCDGRMTLEEAVADTKQKSRNYAKRQLTWFRRDARIVWLSGFGTDAEVVCSAIEHLRRHLGKH